MKQFIIMLVIVTGSFMASGCASTGGTYSRGQVGTVQQVNFGTVEHVRPVLIEGKSGAAGAGIGAVVGGIVGSGIGSGSGRDIATVLGAVGGGVLGYKTQKDLTKVFLCLGTLHPIDGRLYLNLDERIQDQWLKDVPGRIKTADKNWKQIKDKSPQSL